MMNEGYVHTRFGVYSMKKPLLARARSLVVRSHFNKRRRKLLGRDSSI